MAAYISVPVSLSAEPAPPLSSIAYNATAPSGLVSGVTGAVSAPLAAEPVQGPAAFGDPTGSDGTNSPDFVATSQQATSTGASQSAG